LWGLGHKIPLTPGDQMLTAHSQNDSPQRIMVPPLLAGRIERSKNSLYLIVKLLLQLIITTRVVGCNI